MTASPPLRLCLDLNVWCAAYLASRAGRDETAAQTLVRAAQTGWSVAGPIQNIISWGMLERLRQVLVRQLAFEASGASDLVEAIAGATETGPSLTLGGVGVIPILDAEDRHVLETAWAGRADVLVTANLADFPVAKAETLRAGRLYRLSRGAARIWLAHPFEAAAALREGRPFS